LDEYRFPNKKAVEDQKENLFDADLSNMNLGEADLSGAQLAFLF